MLRLTLFTVLLAVLSAFFCGCGGGGDHGAIHDDHGDQHNDHGGPQDDHH
jgi:hypothetical protein